MASLSHEDSTPADFLDREINLGYRVKIEIVLYAILIVFAILSRSYDLGSRVMSHDESLHTYFSWKLYQGQGYDHTPLTHGPLQFHILSLTYNLLGDTDLTARIPYALAGVASIGLFYAFRRWLGRKGALIASLLMLLSPFMLYYQRYVRNEALVVLLALLTFLAVFRYVETREARWLYLFALSTSLHLAAKETAFIYSAQLLIFLGLYLAWDILSKSWDRKLLRNLFVGGSAALVFGLGVAIYAYLAGSGSGGDVSGVVNTPLDPFAAIQSGENTALGGIFPLGIIVSALSFILILIALFLEFKKRLRIEFPTLDLLVILLTTLLPFGSALFARVLGWDPLAYTESGAFNRSQVTILLLAAVSIVIGLLWDWKRWLIASAFFFVPALFLFTTMFTNERGLASGLIGSLGYWIVQHGEQRGSQPLYYYLLIQIPFYEFLPALGAMLAASIGLTTLGKKLGLRVRAFRRREMLDANKAPAEEQAVHTKSTTRFPVPLFFGFWAVSAFLIYSFAGERMPWLAVHITLPMIFLTGWAVEQWIKAIEWRDLWSLVAGLRFALLVVGGIALLRSLGFLLGEVAPFSGNEIENLKITSDFLFTLLGGITAIAIAEFYLRRVDQIPASKLGLVGVFVLLLVLTGRTAYRAAYLDYDQATEFLVYAHAARGVKDTLAIVEEYSFNTTDGLALDVAFDDDVSWPMTWYFRNYTNDLYYGADPSRDLLNHELVIAGDNHFSEVDALLRDRYYSMETIRMWWPMQDYYGLTTDRIRHAFTTPALRAALWDIWFERDYSAYGEVVSREFSLENWNPSDRMRLYVRKDAATRLWDLGVSRSAFDEISFADPYEEGMTSLSAAILLGAQGAEPGQFNEQHGIAFAADGSYYVADSRNHRIQHIGVDGALINEWGSPSELSGEAVPALGTFNEPWDIAVAPDGSVYVADTWNHRVQHFSSDGEVLGSFGVFGQGNSLEELWGPRAVTVDHEGKLYVSDTGNKRIVVIDSNGDALASFGGAGSGPGELNEPVGVAVDSAGLVYVADTWNQRVQVFEEVEENIFEIQREWTVDGWYGQSGEGKPFLAISPGGTLCLTDPETFRVLCFASDGSFVSGWGDSGSGADGFTLPSGLAFSPQGMLWISDAGAHRLMGFQVDLP
jgi:predicted membrane-bound mannosyltransferase/DNA-binding beta-propeller fold protein YncE